MPRGQQYLVEDQEKPGAGSLQERRGVRNLELQFSEL